MPERSRVLPTKPPRASRRRATGLLVLVAVLALVAACGSTVQVGEPGAVQAPSGDPAASGNQGLEYVPPSEEGGEAPGGGAVALDESDGDLGAEGGADTDGQSGSDPGPAEAAPPGSGSGGGTDGEDPGEPTSDGAPIRIGIIVPEGNAGAAFGESLGFENYERIANALVASLNDAGGIAGRQIEHVVREASQDDQSEESQTRQAEAICASLTQDTTVDVVVADLATGTHYALDCYAKAQTPVLVPSTVLEDARVTGLRPWVLPYPMHTPNRVARELPRLLSQRGALTKKVGVLAYDQPTLKRVVEEVFKPAVEQHGGKVLETVYMKAAYDDIGAQVSSAVLRFKTQGIDVVVPGFAPGGGVTGLFMHQAESQSYRPTYGLSSLDIPVIVDETMGAPPAQMSNSVGVGYLPAFDVPQSQYPPTTREKECWKAVNEQLGTAYSSRGPTAQNGYAALQLCDLLWLVKAALDPAAGRAVETSQIIEYVEALGDGYSPVQVPQAKFAPKRPDGAAVQRLFGFDAEGCSCFTYTGDWTPVG